MMFYLKIKLADEGDEANFGRLATVQHGILRDCVPFES
jgi:hypothetical protein